MSLKKVCFGVFPAAMAADWPRPFLLGTSMMAGERLRGPRRAMIDSDFQFPSDHGCVSCRWLSLGPLLMVAFPGSDSGFFWDTAQGSFLWLHATLLASPLPCPPPIHLVISFCKKESIFKYFIYKPSNKYSSRWFLSQNLHTGLLFVSMGRLLTESSSP